MSRGILYAVGIGPGDPELITLKALRILNAVHVIAVPKGRESGESVALSIIEGTIDMTAKRILEIHFPMTKGSKRNTLLPSAQEVLSVLDTGQDIAFITLGDPTLYSTFFHLLDSIQTIAPDLVAEIIPGVSSIMASAARAGHCLALSGDKVAIIPATYIADLDTAIEGFQTVVLMKAHSVIGQIKDVLGQRGLVESAVYVARAGHGDEIVKPLSKVTEDDLNYFSTVIVRIKNA